MTTYKTDLVGRLGIKGTFECRDEFGNVLKTIELSGSIPLTEAQAEQLIQEADHGTDDCA
jgi:hypothetical protein